MALISALHAQPTTPILPDFTPVSWLPVIVPALEKASMPAAGITLAADGVGTHKGDTVTVLAQATDKKGVRQWAVTLSINDIKPEERLLRSPALTMHLNTGRKVEFSPSPYEGMLIHVLGPYTGTKGASGAKDIWSGSLINPQYLGLGIDRTAAFWMRIEQSALHDPSLKGQHFSLSISTNPFPAEQIDMNRIWIDRLAITEAEDRAYAGFLPSMMDFFGIASQTPGVKDIIYEALDIPWWSIAAHGGRITETNFELLAPFSEMPAADWGLPAEIHVYSLGLRLHLQGKPALNCRLALTEPRVPLLNSAGIVGIAAMRPDGKGPRLMIRVMAGKQVPGQP